MAKNKVKKELKLFTVRYRAEVKREAQVEAYDEADARSKFDDGDYTNEYDVDLLDIDDICVYEEES
jgi:hypothetical protein